MKIILVGPGALGGLLASLLTEAGGDVWLLDHRPERADFVNRRGFTVEDARGERRVHVRVTVQPDQTADADLILICVKAYQTEGALFNVVPYLSAKSRILTLQNGLGNLEVLAGLCGPDRVWAGVTAQGATELGLGHIRHAGSGDTAFGSAFGSPDEKRLSEVADLFTAAGIPSRVESDVQSLIWSKLIVNIGINPLTAVTRLRNGQLLEYPGSAKVMEQLVKEAVDVARTSGIRLLYPDPLERVREVARVTSGNLSSMLQDILAKRRTEIDYINGAIVKEGDRVGIATPVNETMAGLVKTIESSYGVSV